MTIAIVQAANSPTFGSTPAMTEKEIASGIRARPTTRPASTSVRSTVGEDGQAGRPAARSRARAEVAKDKDDEPVVLGHAHGGGTPGACGEGTRWCRATSADGPRGGPESDR